MTHRDLVAAAMLLGTRNLSVQAFEHRLASYADARYQAGFIAGLGTALGLILLNVVFFYLRNL